jgi:hypothetical protein
MASLLAPMGAAPCKADSGNMDSKKAQAIRSQKKCHTSSSVWHLFSILFAQFFN